MHDAVITTPLADLYAAVRSAHLARQRGHGIRVLDDIHLDITPEGVWATGTNRVRLARTLVPAETGSAGNKDHGAATVLLGRQETTTLLRMLKKSPVFKRDGAAARLRVKHDVSGLSEVEAFTHPEEHDLVRVQARTGTGEYPMGDVERVIGRFTGLGAEDRLISAMFPVPELVRVVKALDTLGGYGGAPDTPVAITFASAGHTDATITQVGREEQISIPLTTYTPHERLVGARFGFRPSAMLDAITALNLPGGAAARSQHVVLSWSAEHPAPTNGEVRVTALAAGGPDHADPRLLGHFIAPVRVPQKID